MNTVKIALCQMDVIDNKQENISKATSMINEAVSLDSNFIVLPEMFNCPYSNDKFIEYAEEENSSPTLESISKLAKKHQVYILAGSIPEKEDTRIYNTSYLFDRKGEIIAKHRKMHLFDVDVEGGIYFKESDTLTPGNEFSVAQTEFGKIGMGICYEVFCIGVAPALNEDASYHSYGHSIAVNPWGEVICQLDYKEELKTVEINLDEIKKVRNEIPVLKNKRNDLYEIIEK